MLWLETGDKVACCACANRSTQSTSWHTFEVTHTGSLHYPSATLCGRGRGNSPNVTVPTSLPGGNSLLWRNPCTLCLSYVYCAKNGTDVSEAGYPNTVKPAYNDHPVGQANMVAQDRWSQTAGRHGSQPGTQNRLSCRHS